MHDSVFVRGLEFEANHGYTASERRGTRRFRVAMELSWPLDRASSSDSLKDTVDYRELCAIAMDIGTNSTCKLLETLAGNIARAVQDKYPAAEVKIELEKLMPPCPGVPDACGVRLTVPPMSSR